MGDKVQRGTIHAEGVEVRPVKLDLGEVWFNVVDRSVVRPAALVPAEWFTPDPDPYDGWTADRPWRSSVGEWNSKIRRPDGSTHEVFYRATAKEAQAAADARLAELRAAAQEDKP